MCLCVHVRYTVQGYSYQSRGIDCRYMYYGQNVDGKFKVVDAFACRLGIGEKLSGVRSAWCVQYFLIFVGNINKATYINLLPADMNKICPKKKKKEKKTDADKVF